MTKHVLTALSLFLVLSPSQAKMTPVERALVSQKRSVLMSQMQTKNVVARATPRTRRKLLDIDDRDDPAGPDELDLQAPYRKPRIVENPRDDAVSDYVSVRLAVARARAMAIHRKTWANSPISVDISTSQHI